MEYQNLVIDKFGDYKASCEHCGKEFRFYHKMDGALITMMICLRCKHYMTVEKVNE